MIYDIPDNNQTYLLMYFEYEALIYLYMLQEI
jgi:hypothetical protein